MSTCGSCAHFAQDFGYAHNGECRRFPPHNTPTGQSKYTQVKTRTPSCGEFREREGDAVVREKVLAQTPGQAARDAREAKETTHGTFTPPASEVPVPPPLPPPPQRRGKKWRR